MASSVATRSTCRRWPIQAAQPAATSLASRFTSSMLVTRKRRRSDSALLRPESRVRGKCPVSLRAGAARTKGKRHLDLCVSAWGARGAPRVHKSIGVL